ncbi:MAG: hypothetical protein A2086_00620 [Spirochaetes bacterium GWD1_27_9]|nr:MAG: hypothetical protein A2Z98_05130 [Spirochaetes bacterium GWB1_27_13]OHD25042.1 MAG: hypothetical protein A2Y34_03185 [Spirochaetes bacterium GWC1_27_15]OHD32513.1 MAG: hypothetical protein A2086_00620 [Spirochaetes bacterium GWD1_27_9]
MKFEEMKNKIDNIFKNYSTEEMISDLEKFGYTLEKVNSEDQAGFYIDEKETLIHLLSTQTEYSKPFNYDKIKNDKSEYNTKDDYSLAA